MTAYPYALPMGEFSIRTNQIARWPPVSCPLSGRIQSLFAPYRGPCGRRSRVRSEGSRTKPKRAGPWRAGDGTVSVRIGPGSAQRGPAAAADGAGGGQARSAGAAAQLRRASATAAADSDSRAAEPKRGAQLAVL